VSRVNNEDKNKIFQLNKQDFPIGIFGSFKYGRLSHLQSLRDYLNSNDYFARLSENIDPHFNDKNFKKPIGYDLEISEKLIDISKIHIFVFYHEKRNQHHTGESPAIELSYLKSKIIDHLIQNPKIIIFIQNGIEKEVGSLLRDLILDKRYWREFPFTNLEDIFEQTITLCNNFIRPPQRCT
jgi:hypothetical protein